VAIAGWGVRDAYTGFLGCGLGAYLGVIERADTTDRAGAPAQADTRGELVHGLFVHGHQLLSLVVVEVIDTKRGLGVLGDKVFEARVVMKALQGQYQSSLAHW